MFLILTAFEMAYMENGILSEFLLPESLIQAKCQRAFGLVLM